MCGCGDINPPDEGSWASCNDCGHVQYDEDTLALRAEVQAEQAYAKAILGEIPTYEEWVRYREGENDGSN
jgi:hypothetical protein